MEPSQYLINQRRLRASTQIRELTATVKLSYKSFIQPLFVDEAITTAREVESLPNVLVDTSTSIIETINDCIKNGVTKFLLFPVPANKYVTDFDFSFATGIVKKIKQHFGNNIWLAVDVCLCSYTTHGHCGILDSFGSCLLNNETVILLSTYATQLANAGADCIAPSDMMDGRIKAIRHQLNNANKDDVSIMSYSAKFSSQFYGPFRDACHSSPKSSQLKNRKTYQLSPFNLHDAMASAKRDEEEGADIIMIKPAALYTDVITKIKQQTLKPIAAYHVSGEYAAIELLAQQKLVEREAAHIEVWTALTRAGADIIISYAAKHAKKWIEEIAY